MTVLTARAAVLTSSPERYAKQLLSHLGRRTSWTTSGTTSTAEITGGTGRVVVGDGRLMLIAEARDAATLSRVQNVLGSHLERFGQHNELTVTWIERLDRSERDHRSLAGPFLSCSPNGAWVPSDEVVVDGRGADGTR
jgi:uncharacterized protein